MHYSLGNGIYNKQTLYLAAIIVIILLLIVGTVRRCTKEEETASDYEEDIVQPTQTNLPPSGDTVPTISVYNHSTNTIEEMNLEDYVVASVAGEMPASFSMEALKAQAIACRTYAYQRIGTGAGCNNSDICTESSHGQGFLNSEQMLDIWGEDYNKWLTIIEQSVLETAGEIITYNNQPIEVMYHASSNGATENSGEVFVSDKPYLVSVASYDEGIVIDTEVFSIPQFTEQVNASYPEAKLMLNTADKDIDILSHTTSGRVEKIKLGDAILTGREFRELFGLKSTEFEISIDGAQISITTKGYGHGVGMSQRGANEMAAMGYNCYDILVHYYTGTDIGRVY